MAGRIINTKLDKFVQDELANFRTSEIVQKCPFCGNSAELLYKVQSFNNTVDVYNYYKCHSCDFIFLGDFFYEFINDKYKFVERKNNYKVQDIWFSNNENYKNPKYQHTYWLNEKKQIIKLGYKSGRILDIGCAAGQFLAQFNNQFDKYGVELSDLSALAKQKNITVYKQPVEDLSFEKEHFDVISAYALIEHLEDPFGCIEKITSWLKTGGLLVLGTNDINSYLTKYRKQYYQDLIPPEHITLLSYNFYKTFLAQHGYEVIYKKHINGGYCFSHNNILNKMEIILSKLMLNYYPFNHIPIYDHFYIYARKIS